jgi:hypothetical protein
MAYRTATAKIAATVAATVFVASITTASAQARPADPDARTTNVTKVTPVNDTPERSWTLVQIGYRAKLDRMPT